MSKALSLVSDGGTVVITDMFTYTGEKIFKKCTIASMNDRSRFDCNNWSLILGADVAFKNIIINSCIANVFFLAYGNALTFDDKIPTQLSQGCVGISILFKIVFEFYVI